MVAFNLRKFTDPDLLKTIEQGRLRAFLVPWASYFEDRGLSLAAGKHTDCELLAHILMSPGIDVPKDMVDALYYVHETSSVENMDALLELARQRGVSVEQDARTTVADVAIQFWLEAPELLRERHAETVAFRQRNFLYYGGAKGGACVFPAVSDDLRTQIELELDNWFEQHRRGRGCRVFLFPHGRQVWIVIRHGSPMRREASHGDDGQTSTEFYRPQQHDVLIYDTSSDELGVHAGTKGETKLYLTVLGRHVFGDGDHFPPSSKFSLSPLIEDGAKSLLCEDVQGLERIRLVEFRREWGGQFRESETRRASDIFAAMSLHEKESLGMGRLSGAVFKVKFTDSSKERSVTIRPPGIAKYERDDDSALIEAWLSKRGFMAATEGENDEEAPSAVLEGPGRDPERHDGLSRMEAPSPG